MTPGDVINYTVTIEHIEDGDIGGDTEGVNIALTLGNNNVPALMFDSPATCTFNGTANATYTVTVTLNAGDWSVNKNTIMTQSTTVTADENGLVSFELGYTGWDEDSGAFTLTLTATN